MQTLICFSICQKASLHRWLPLWPFLKFTFQFLKIEATLINILAAFTWTACHAMQCHSIQCHAMQDFLFCQVALIGSCADLMSFTNSSQVGIRMMLFLCYVGWRFSIQISLNRGAQSKIFTMQLAYSLLGKTFVTTVRDQ